MLEPAHKRVNLMEDILCGIWKISRMHGELQRVVEVFKVAYAEKNELLQAIVLKYHPDWLKEDDTPPEDVSAGGQSQDVPSQKQRKRSSKKKGPANRQNRPLKEVAPHNREPEVVQDGPV